MCCCIITNIKFVQYSLYDWCIYMNLKVCSLLILFLQIIRFRVRLSALYSISGNDDSLVVPSAESPTVLSEAETCKKQTDRLFQVQWCKENNTLNIFTYGLSFISLRWHSLPYTIVFSGILSGSVKEHAAPITQPLVNSTSRATCALKKRKGSYLHQMSSSCNQLYIPLISKILLSPTLNASQIQSVSKTL